MPGALTGTLETILVCDYDATLLSLVVAILKQANFNVLAANTGEEAIELEARTDQKIDLLLSDVEMPGTSGPELGQKLKKLRPDMRVMLMSGGDHGNLLVLNYGWAYIQKPFLSMKLVQMVTDVLHSEDRSQLGDEFDSRKDTGRKGIRGVQARSVS